MLSLLSLIPGVGQVLGGIAGGRAEGKIAEAELRQNADKIALDRARLGQDQYDSSIDRDLDQRRYADSSNDRSARNALMAGLLGGLQDYEMNLPAGLEAFAPKSTGGLKPSAIGNRDEISRLAMETAMSELENPLQPGGIAREQTQGTTAVPRQPPQAGFGRLGGPADRPQPAAGGGDVGASGVIAPAATQGRSLPQILLSQLPQASELPKAGLFDKILQGLSMGASIYGAAGSPGAGGSGTSGARITATGNPGTIMRNAGVRF
jgi:hypothetical protein